MKQTINFSQFCDEFRNMNRDNNFSYEGKRALFEYLEELEQGQDEQMELDIIALCCEYTESTIKEALDSYNLSSLDELRDNTTVIEVNDDTIIYANF